MNFYDLVNSRYSIRGYTDQAVPEDALQRILEAARMAPSACNIQPWRLYVISDEETRRKLLPRQPWAADAPIMIVACCDKEQAWVRSYDGKNHADVDMGIFMEHMILAATEEGLNTCWICAFDPEIFRTVLKLPKGIEPVAATPLGYANAEPQPRIRKPLEEIVTRIK